MKKVYLLLAVVLLCGMVSAQNEVKKTGVGLEQKTDAAGLPEVKQKQRVRFVLQGSVGSMQELTFDEVGVGESLAGLIEVPISKRYKGWKLSTGLRFTNKNQFCEASLSVTEPGTNNVVSESMVTQNTHTMFIEVPLIFSYDFRFYNDTQALRIGFGLYYSRYLYGGMYVMGESIGSPYRTMYGSMRNVGWNCGLSYWINDWFIGLDFEALADVLSYRSDFSLYSNISATFGYRF